MSPYTQQAMIRAGAVWMIAVAFMGCVPVGERLQALPTWDPSSTAILVVVDPAGRVVKGPRIMPAGISEEVGLPDKGYKLIIREYEPEVGIEQCGLTLGGGGARLPSEFTSWLLVEDADGELVFQAEPSPTTIDLRYERCNGRSVCNTAGVEEVQLDTLKGFLPLFSAALSDDEFIFFADNPETFEQVYWKVRRGEPPEVQPLPPGPPQPHLQATKDALWALDVSGGVHEFPFSTGEWITWRTQAEGDRFLRADGEGRLYEVGPGPTLSWVDGSTTTADDLPGDLIELVFGQGGDLAYVTSDEELFLVHDGEVTKPEIEFLPTKSTVGFTDLGFVSATNEQTVLISETGELRTIFGSRSGLLPRAISGLQGGILLSGKFGLLEFYDGQEWCDFGVMTDKTLNSMAVGPSERRTLILGRSLNLESSVPSFFWLE